MATSKPKPSKSVDSAVAAVQSAQKAHEQAQADLRTLEASVSQARAAVDNAFHDLQASKDALIAAALKGE